MKTSLCILLFSAFGLISAVTPDPRFKQGCVTLKQKIYCYGGGQYVAGGINYNKVLKDHLVLDLTRDFMLRDAQSAWTTLPSQANFTLEPNYSYGYTVLSPTSYLITSGSGYNDGKTFLNNKTTIYHADLNQWESVPTIANQSIGTTINADNKGKVYLFGGILTYTNTIPYRNFSTLDVNSEQWSTSVLGNGTIFRADHASAMDNNGTIYHVGGRLGTASGASAYTWNNNVPLTTMETFNTTSKTWKSIRVGGSVPTPRNSHSFTYVPKINQFILFGGKEGSSESPGSFADICYTFDPNTSTWTQRNVSQIGSGARFGHSAVLYMDRYLFIIFGADHVTMSMNSFSLLDIETWTWLDNFSATGNPNLTSSNDNGNNNSGNRNTTNKTTIPTNGNNKEPAAPGSLGGSAIAGIVVGVIAFVGLAAAALFFVRRRPHNKENVEHPPNYFSHTTDKFMKGSAPQSLDQPYQEEASLYQPSQKERTYHPDEASLLTKPADSTISPTLVSPSSTVVSARHMQYKPDLSLNFDQDLVKPHYSS